MQLRFACFALLLMPLAACSPDAPRETGPATSAPAAQAPIPQDAECSLTMGWDPWPPFHFTELGGEIMGLDVELLQAMAKDAGCELDFERDSWASLLGRIRNGSIDLLTGATITEDRQDFAHFSAPLRPEEFALYIRSEDAGTWAERDLRALMEQGMRLGITDGYIYDDSVEDLLNDPAFAEQVVRSRFGETSIERLLENEIDGLVEEVFAAKAMIRRLGFEGSIARHEAPLGETVEVRIMYSKATVPAELVARMDESLARLRQSGVYEELTDRYRK
jgi:polar amino acid transport system substrate-binding protein